MQWHYWFYMCGVYNTQHLHVYLHVYIYIDKAVLLKVMQSCNLLVKEPQVCVSIRMYMYMHRDLFCYIYSKEVL